MKRLLIADDDAGMRAALEARFRRRGWLVDVAVNGTEALQKFRAGLHSLVITDVRMPGRDGFELMREVQSSSARTAVILLTAYGCVPDAVEAMRNGACDYLVKPVCFEKLELAVEQVLRRAGELGKETETLIGHSPAWEAALERARQAASADADVLIEAESGTGKELVARLIHRLSPRKAGPFVALNCTAFPETLLESELFGHARGAFTGAVGARPGKFETANGGTLLLDEVGEMPLALQPKLLRALQEREFDRLGSNQTVRVDIRVIATSNRPLETAVAEGRFRADLFYRLNVIPISLPPLRDRAGDIRELAEYFAGLYAAPRTQVLLSRDLVARLEEHAWPGNVRELGNFVRRAVALSRGGEIGVEALEHGQNQTGKILPRRQRSPEWKPEWKPGLSLGEMERQLFAMTLESTGGNRARAAELLGVSLRTVRNKVREFGLPPRNNYRNEVVNRDLQNPDLHGDDLRGNDLLDNHLRNSNSSDNDNDNANAKEQPCP
ncbi:MAG TPA: sigma-54 dependent transcriptional regulator [Candidatus Acidoferrales bacterium]|nr:sigma-54 dependent transcriptional regulator [Candidatus Acidoferrales bacterium]